MRCSLNLFPSSEEATTYVRLNRLGSNRNSPEIGATLDQTMFETSNRSIISIENIISMIGPTFFRDCVLPGSSTKLNRECDLMTLRTE